jgi:hypothetical protein
MLWMLLLGTTFPRTGTSSYVWWVILPTLVVVIVVRIVRHNKRRQG